MKLDQVFGVLLILLAIYLGVNAATREDVDAGVFGNLGDRIADDGGDADTGGNGSSGGSGSGGGNNDSGGGNGNGNGNGSKNKNQQKQQSAPGEAAISKSSFCAGAPQESFTDVGKANDAAIGCMDAANIMNGTSDTQFDPEEAVTRGQAASAIAAMIDRANELATKDANLRELPPADDARFEDVTTDTPNRLAIARLNETPILQGYVDARYEPAGKVTRGQMASLLDRSYQYLNRGALAAGPNQFDDDDTSVHEDSINAVAGADIMGGVGGRRFAPQQSVRRGDLASYLSLMMVRMEDKGRIKPLPRNTP